MNQKPQKLANALRIGLLLAATLYFLAHFDMTSLVFPRWNESPQSQTTPQNLPDSHNEATQKTQVIPDQPQVEPAVMPAERVTDNFYTFKDEQGVIHMVNDLEKVPPKYRNRMKVTTDSKRHGNVTPVIINRNQVLVPVTLSYRGHSAEARLLLDTGANTTTVSERLASRLGVEASDVQAGKATVADGRSLRSYMFMVDSLTVGPHTLFNVQTSVLPGSGGDEHEGLLGMDFLKNFRYHINFDRSVIEWGA